MVKQPGHLTSMKKEPIAFVSICTSWCVCPLGGWEGLRTRRWHELLELVLAGLSLRGRIQKIDGENLLSMSALALWSPWSCR